MILFGRFFQKAKPKEEPDIENSITDESYLLDIFSPDSIEEGANYLRLGGNYVRTLAVSHFSNQVEAGFLEKLHTMSSNVSVIHHIEPTPSHEMVKALNRAVIEYKSRLQEPRLRPVDQIKLENDLQDAEILLQNLVEGSSEMFVEHMLVHIQADSLDKLNSITHQVKTQMSRSIKLLTPNFRMLEAFQSVLPVRSHKIPEMTYRNFDSESISSLFPFDECEIVSEKGIIKGKNLKTNSVVLVDHDELLNRNEVVIATSGGGKSTYLFGDIMRRWMQGTTIRIVDPKGEFGEKARKLGGEWIKISPMNDNVINPFEIMNATIAMDESGQPLEASLLHQKISRLKTMFTLMYKDLKEQQVAMALLEKVLVEVYRDKGITWDTNFKTKQSSDYPTIRDLYQKIDLLMHTEEQYSPLAGFYQVLYPYVEGSYSKAFNGVTNVDLSNDFIVFDLFDLRNEGDLQQVAMFNILTFLWDDVTMDKTKVHQIFVDEAHILSDPKNPLAMEFLASMYKLIRSFSGGVTSATQQVGDFLSAVEGSRNYGEAVILNSVTKLYLPMVQEEMNSIRERTSESFSEEEERLLVIQDADKHQNAGKGIYVVGSKKVHLQVELTPAELKLWDAAWYQRKYGDGV